MTVSPTQSLGWADECHQTRGRERWQAPAPVVMMSAVATRATRRMIHPGEAPGSVVKEEG